MDETTIIAEALELQAIHRDAEEQIQRLMPLELQEEAQRLRAELPAKWPALEPVLARVDDEDRVRGQDWMETGLGRDAYEAFVRYQAVMRQLRIVAEPEIVE